ncbi:MAG: SelB C-terminal domain-containing protein, partial [Eubacteriales bacterium]|nr:SelB C-terminal domain-containing protein [Eubacteriales bacterium]
KGMEQTAADALLAELCRGGRIRRCGERYALSDFQVHFTKKQTAIKDKLLAYFQHADIEPDSVEDVIAAYPQNERSECKQVLDSLFTGGELVLLSPQICYHKDAFDKACRVVYKHFEDHELMTLAEFRDALGTSRKYAMAVLEYLDSARVTKKEGDARRLLKKL